MHSQHFSNYINEFVFKRKRKRSRINVNVQDTESDAVSLDQTGDQFQSGLIPEIAMLLEPPTSSPAFADSDITKPPSPGVSSGKIVTIEQFLRRSAQINPGTKQVVPGSVPIRRYRARTRQRPTERRTVPAEKALKVSKRPKRTPRIAKTLFRAAVLTNGDPIDTLMDTGVSLTRRPLKFVPCNRFSSPRGPNQTEPESAGPLFSDHAKDAALHTQSPCDTSDPKANHHRSSGSYLRMPLNLVPFREAEVAYSAMFPSRRTLLKHL